MNNLNDPNAEINETTKFLLWEIDEKTYLIVSSVVAAIILTLVKFLVGVWSGSLGILSGALHSALDLLAAGITLFTVRLALKPADQDHQFGHGKIESLSALFETILLLFTQCYDLLKSTIINVINLINLSSDQN